MTGQPSHGLWWGFLGVLAFSFTVPFTRVAAESGNMSPLFIGAGRAVIASLAAAIVLTVVWSKSRRWSLASKSASASPGSTTASATPGSTTTSANVRRPTRNQCLRLLLVAAGIVLGFPLLTSYALAHTPATHGAIVIALLPAATAAAAVIRTKESTGLRFWIMAALSAVLAVVFALVQGGGFSGFQVEDVLLFGAVIAAAAGYAEGGVLSRELGSWQTVSWALVLSSPITIALTVVSIIQSPPTGSIIEWSAFGYLAIISMFLGFFAWYRGLAIGPMAQVSQVQLVQPVMTIAWAALLLGERLDWLTVACGAAVIAFAALTVRTRLKV